MTYETVLYEVEDRICTLTLNRPEKLNAFSKQLIREFAAALEQADRDEAAAQDRSSIYDYRMYFLREFEEFTKAWQISKPVIASVHGYAIGKGFELALFSDITIVTEDTRLGYNEFRYGISAFSFYLPWLVNMKTAKDLVLTGSEVSAREAKEIGLVTRVVAPEDLERVTHETARLVATMPGDLQRMHKTAINRVYEVMGIQTALGDYLEIMSILGACPAPEYEEFSRITREQGLKAALAWGNARYDD
jgi:enoyl-CoA hydratase/carnithine racemase